jgi:urease accessory protein
MVATAPLSSEVFAGNRAVGRVAFAVAAGPGGTRRTRVQELGSLRVRFPNGDREAALDAVIVNTSGGMAGGDRFDISIKVAAGARLTVTTAAAEKIYRSLGPDTHISIKLDIGPGGALAWLPQETIMFDQVRLRRAIDVDIAPGGSLLLAEPTVFGRSAMGETVARGRFLDYWRIRAGGALIFAEATRLDGKISQCLMQRATAGGGVALASVIKYPGGDDDVAAIGTRQDNFAGEVGVSAWNGLAVARMVAPDGAALRRDLATALTALHPGALPRLWLN